MSAVQIVVDFYRTSWLWRKLKRLPCWVRVVCMCQVIFWCNVRYEHGDLAKIFVGFWFDVEPGTDVVRVQTIRLPVYILRNIACKSTVTQTMLTSEVIFDRCDVQTNTVFRGISPCSLVKLCRRFIVIWFCSRQGRWWQQVSPKRLYVCTGLQTYSLMESLPR